jgi:2-polyprenyl-3-methyl-5-hydroxy-6-metoxy-1,4-benzoquinol methylase
MRWHLYEKSLFSQQVKNQVKRHLSVTDPIRVLEAGCGRKWGLDLSGLEYHLTGVDLDEKALEARVNNEKDLDLAILGDLRTVSLPKRHYDLVYNGFVLEHVKGAEEVLNNLFNWVKPGGIVVLEIPDGDSVFGFFTKHTPHLLHILYYRYVLKSTNAGKPGHQPYPTVYDKIVSRKSIHRYCAEHGHTILAEYYSPFPLASDFGRFTSIISIFVKVVSILSCGRLAPYHNDIHFIIRDSGT